MSLTKQLKSKIEKYRFRLNLSLSQSDVFCMAPWIQLHAQTNGKVAPCCMASIKDGNEIGDLRLNPNLQHAWNSENMRKLRLNMLSGKRSSICSNCYDHQEIGKTSERQTYNRDFAQYYKRIKNTQANGEIDEKNVLLIDLRFSNKCNYKCRICNTDYSSLWYEEEKKLGYNPTQKEIKMVNDETAFWDSYKELLPGVKRLHFAGGEPLFMDEHYKVLDYLIEIGKTDVNLTYNTNFSTLRYKKYNVVDMWNKFHQVDVWASLDGMSDRGDYQRKGQNWAKIEDNIREVKAGCNNVVFGINATVSIFNIFHIPDFFEYMVENKFVQPERMNLYPLYYPNSFRVTNLPANLKQDIILKYENFERSYLSKFSKDIPIKNHIQALLNYMQSENGVLIEEFQRKVREVDNLRGEDFSTVFPELKGLMQ